MANDMVVYDPASSAYSVAGNYALSVILDKAIDEGIVLATGLAKRTALKGYDALSGKLDRYVLDSLSLEKIAKSTGAAKKYLVEYKKKGSISVDKKGLKTAVLGTSECIAQARALLHILRELTRCHASPSLESSARIYHLHGMLDDMDVSYQDLYSVIDMFNNEQGVIR